MKRKGSRNLLTRTTRYKNSRKTTKSPDLKLVRFSIHYRRVTTKLNLKGLPYINLTENYTNKRQMYWLYKKKLFIVINLYKFIYPDTFRNNEFTLSLEVYNLANTIGEVNNKEKRFIF